MGKLIEQLGGGRNAAIILICIMPSLVAAGVVLSALF